MDSEADAPRHPSVGLSLGLFSAVVVIMVGWGYALSGWAERALTFTPGGAPPSGPPTTAVAAIVAGGLAALVLGVFAFTDRRRVTGAIGLVAAGLAIASLIVIAAPAPTVSTPAPQPAVSHCQCYSGSPCQCPGG